MKAGLCFLLLIAGSAAAQSFRLENGLQVIVQEDHRIPQVALYLFYRIGSRNEHPGITGISHFFEHMMFNGTRKFGPKQFDLEMEKRGGRNNAYTTRDLTVYTDWFPREALPVMMEMEADRMNGLDLSPKSIESERGVVFSERQRSVEDSPLSFLYERLNASAFIAHPYSWPVIGWASDIRAWTQEDLKNHYRTGYAPNNCLMVLAGDVHASEAQALVQKFFGSVPGQKPLPPVRTVEPEPMGERRIAIHRPAEMPIWMASFPAPNSMHGDYLPLQMLTTILSEGRSSRLYRRLVDRDQQALSAGAYYDPQIDPGQIVFSVQPRAGVAPAQVERTLWEEVEKIRSQEVSPAEMQKARNIMLVSHYRELRSIAGQANMLGLYEIYFGDHRKIATVEADLNQVTPARILSAARQYLAPDRRTVAILVPTPKGDATR